MAFDKSTLGNRHTCFECEIKFYDLNKDPICPKEDCGADMRDNPNPDAREAFLASLSTRGRKKKKKEEEVTEAPVAVEESEESDEDTLADANFSEEDDDMGLSADDLLSGGEEEEESFE